MKAIFKLLNPDNTMSINRQLAHAIGLAEAVVYGALLSKYAYYDQHGLLTDGDWFYSTVEDLEESTALSARQQRRCIETLIKSGLIQCKVQGMPAKRYFCINDDTELLAGILSNGSKSSCDKSAQLDGTVKQSEPVTNGITEPSSTSDGSAPVMTKAHNLFSPNVTTCSNEKEEQDFTKPPNCSIYKTKEIKPKQDFLVMLDNGVINIAAAEMLADLSTDVQGAIINVLAQHPEMKLTGTNIKELHGESNLTPAVITKILKPKPPIKIAIPAEIVAEFMEGKTAEELTEIVSAAIRRYFTEEHDVKI